jgi:hypothetical protein
MHPTPIRHHGGAAVTGAQQPWREFDFERGFPEVRFVLNGVELFEAGGPLDAPSYIPRGGAEVFDSGVSEPAVFWCEMREGV